MLFNDCHSSDPDRVAQTSCFQERALHGGAENARVEKSSRSFRGAKCIGVEISAQYCTAGMENIWGSWTIRRRLNDRHYTRVSSVFTFATGRRSHTFIQHAWQHSWRRRRCWWITIRRETPCY